MCSSLGPLPPALRPEDVSNPERILGATASYWLDLRGYDPPAAAAQVKQPMLVLQGERDYQVTMKEFSRWKSALVDRTDVVFHSYATLNHLFVAGTGKSVPAEYNAATFGMGRVMRSMLYGVEPHDLPTIA